MRKSRETHKAIVLTVAIPERLRQQVASFLGGDIVHDPSFWAIALQTGVEELERQFRKIEADAHERAAEEGSFVIFGSPTVIDVDDHDDDRPFDPDDLPF